MSVQRSGSVIAATSPVAGLIGTIVGICLAFDCIFKSDGQPTVSQLSIPMGEALLVTLGLLGLLGLICSCLPSRR